jgi:hypothetical protein
VEGGGGEWRGVEARGVGCPRGALWGWRGREQRIKYCNQDVISLYQVISKFSNIIFEEFRLDIANHPTLPSLTLAIYRRKFLKDFKLPIITGLMFNDIKKAYKGGNVKVFTTYGENIFHYDVNILYPYAMKNYPMPVGEPTYFEGDILIFNKQGGRKREEA